MVLTFAALTLAAASPQSPALSRICAVDVHLHAYEADPRLRNRVPNPATGVPAPPDAAAHIRATLDEMRAAGIGTGIVSGTPLSAAEAMVWASNGRLRLGYQVNALPTPADLAAIRRLHAAGRLAYIGEVGTPYEGIRYDDPGLEPLWALAEELDVPVALHSSSGPPEQTFRGNPRARLTSGNPLAIEEALVRHPRLKVVLMHMGFPYSDATVALMNGYPSIYVDVAPFNWAIAAPEFRSYLKRLIDNGWERRILYGTDAMTWVDAIGSGRKGLEAVPYLTPEQRRLILRDNALRLFGGTVPVSC
jgi:uncharacterized protein